MLKHLKTFTKGLIESRGKRFNKSKNYSTLTMCKKCYTFYYKNSWHFDGPKDLYLSEETTIPVSFKSCPACLEEEVSSYDMELA